MVNCKYLDYFIDSNHQAGWLYRWLNEGHFSIAPLLRYIFAQIHAQCRWFVVLVLVVTHLGCLWKSNKEPNICVKVLLIVLRLQQVWCKWKFQSWITLASNNFRIPSGPVCLQIVPDIFQDHPIHWRPTL